MADKPYTDADVDLVARALWIESGAPSGRPTPVCVQGARAALDALTAAGWQPPARGIDPLAGFHADNLRLRPAGPKPTGFIALVVPKPTLWQRLRRRKGLTGDV